VNSLLKKLVQGTTLGKRLVKEITTLIATTSLA